MVGAAWGEPYYFNYGDTVYYEDGYVYQDGEQVASSQQYAQQATDLANSASDEAVNAGEDWMPLGVFAMQKEKGHVANMLLRIAVNKEGTISGSYFNESTDGHANIQGAVDKKTQRAAWSFGHDRTPVMETGIFNLTKDETTALVHFDNDKTQQWYLIRQADDQASNAQGDSNSDGASPRSR